MESKGFDKLDKTVGDLEQSEVESRIQAFSRGFRSYITCRDGLFGTSSIDRGNGVIEKVIRDSQGHIRKEYYQDDVLIKIRQKISNKCWETSYFDKDSVYRTDKTVLLPNHKSVTTSEYRRGNYYAQTDHLGRPTYNRMDHIKISPEPTQLNNRLKNTSYQPGDDMGHLISRLFGGPAAKDNIVPEAQHINRAVIKKLENAIKKEVQNGNDVSVEIKTRYQVNSRRPSSFEYKIISNGRESEIVKVLNNKNFKLDNFKGFTFKSTKLKDAKIKNYDNKRLITDKVVLKPRDVKRQMLLDSSLRQGAEFAAFTAIVSTASNMPDLFEGKITPQEMVADVTSDSAIAGITGLATGGITKVMELSGHRLIQKLAHAGAPMAVVSFGIEAHDSVIDYYKGEIDECELAYDLGDSASLVAGGLAGAKMGGAAGAALGTMIVPGAGTAAGGAIGGIVGGTVGSIMASEVYKSGVKMGAEGIDYIKDNAQSMAKNTVELAKEVIPDKVDMVKNAFTDYAKDMNLDFNFFD